MSIAVRPHTKLLAALVAAGAVAAAPTVVTTVHTTPVLSGIDVQPVSFVTDALYSFGDVVNAATNAAVIATDAALGLNFYLDDYDFGAGLPFNPVFAGLAAIQNPGEIGSLLSYAAQAYLNPSGNYPYYTYPYYANDLVLQQLVDILPSSLATPISNAINGVADGIDNVLANLSDPTAGADAMNALYSTVLGRLVYAAQYSLSIPVGLAGQVAYYAAYLPGDLEATVESAIKNPAAIPGLLSNLAYNLLSPTLGDGLLGNVVYTLVKPLFFLPAPIGESSLNAGDGLAWNVYQGFVDVVNNLLSFLPTPVSPAPFGAARSAAALAPAAAAEAEGSSVPQAKAASPHRQQSAASVRADAAPAKSAAAGKATASDVDAETPSTEGSSDSPVVKSRGADSSSSSARSSKADAGSSRAGHADRAARKGAA